MPTRIFVLSTQSKAICCLEPCHGGLNVPGLFKYLPISLSVRPVGCLPAYGARDFALSENSKFGGNEMQAFPLSPTRRDQSLHKLVPSIQALFLSNSSFRVLLPYQPVALCLYIQLGTM